jgi:anion-transporting  ArsA/GET3 family ATPase
VDVTSDLDAWLARTRLVVCVGSGGVGKTTTSAALGLYAAIAGRRVMVLTIDPARRLANSLGLKQFGNEEHRVDLARIPEAKGELWAMMLDSRSTFDALIARVAPSAEARDRILDNHVYRHMADTFAGSQDYMATEKLHDVIDSGRYDLVVLDTPPVKNALDFLESPGRLVNFMDERVLKWFLEPAAAKGFGGALLAGTTAIVYRLLGYIFGTDFLDDLATFFRDFQGLYKGFVERHDKVVNLFRAESTSFVTVCAPTEPSLDVALFFQEELGRRDLPRGGVVVNQVHQCEGPTHDARAGLGQRVAAVAGEVPEATRASVLARLGMAHRRLAALASAEAALIARLKIGARGGGFFQTVERQEADVHDLPALARVGRRLFRSAESL